MPTSTSKRLGILAGEGSLPRIVAQSANKQGYSTYAIAINQQALNDLQGQCSFASNLEFGKFQQWLDFINAHELTEFVVIGKVPKVWALSRLPFFDSLGRQALSQVKTLNDFDIHNTLVDFASHYGVKLIPQQQFLQELLVSAGNLSNVSLTDDQEADLEYGFKMAKKAAELQVSQTIVVKNKSVMAIEAAEGTDQTIERGCKLAKKEAVIIKVAWINQHEELDIPTVGLTTLKTIAKYGGSVLAIEEKKTFVVDLEECMSFAQKHNISFVSYAPR
jgi:UDP-2,3-diacylglucosamine hydrolase